MLRLHPSSSFIVIRSIARASSFVFVFVWLRPLVLFRIRRKGEGRGGFAMPGLRPLFFDFFFEYVFASFCTADNLLSFVVIFVSYRVAEDAGHLAAVRELSAPTPFLGTPSSLQPAFGYG